MRKIILISLLFVSVAACLLFYMDYLKPRQHIQNKKDQEVNSVPPSVVTVESHSLQVYKGKASPVMIPGRGLGFVRRLVGVQPFQYATGIIIHPKGLILTAAHAVSGFQRVSVILYNGKKLDAEIILIVPEYDFALLSVKTTEKLISIEFADSNSVKIDDEIFVVGNSNEEKCQLFKGKVISLGKSLSWAEKNIIFKRLIEADIRLAKGSSGGPLFNSQGKLIGMNIASHMFTQKSSYAIPSNSIKKLFSLYLENKAAFDKP